MEVVGGKAVEDVVTKVTDAAVDSVWRQVGYVRNYKSNISDLEKQLEVVKAERVSMEHNMDEATRKGEIVEKEATIWCKNADAAIGAAVYLLAEHSAANKSCFMGCCPNLMTRHQYSRKAIKETIPALSKVQRERTLIPSISYRKDVQQYERLTNYETLGSRMSIVEEILEALKSTDVNLVGVYGFSGVGKSMLVKQQVVDHVKEKSIFKVVAIANVTHSLDLSKIQQEIADWLGLEFSRGSSEVRAAQLCARLKQEEKVLIILDDIWEKIPLEEIGIPPSKKDHEGCKIIMTSRDQNILSKMGVHRHFHLQALGKDETWQLFKIKAGDFRNPRIQPIAHEVANRCLGLPVLIVAVATSLRDKELYEWIDALEQLQKFDHREMDEKVYSALELSYSYLEADAKSLLVLYAQLPCSMVIFDLVILAIGLNLFHNCKTVKAVRNRLFKVVNDLKNSCFLLEGINELHVRIHDIVHSFAVKFASKEHHVFSVPSKSDLEEWPEKSQLERCTAISLAYCKIRQLPEELECPELRSFLLLNDNLSFQISGNFFSRTKKLKLVGLFRVSVSLPSLGFLKNLQALFLWDCDLEDTRTIGELQNLLVLSFSLSKIVQLPMEIRHLTRLQVLDLNQCEQLEVIPHGILNSLTKLEELCMLGSIVHWESEELKNASLSELKSLPNLINLEIHIVDAKMIPADLFHKKLERFRIFIGSGWYSLGEQIPSKLLKLKLSSDAEVERVKVLLAETENLHLDDVKGVKNVVPQLERRGFPELKELLVKSCDEMELIMGGVNTFSSSSFSNLKKLTVGNCNALRYLFSISVFRCLTQLQELDVSYCQNLEMIVGYEDGDDDSNDVMIRLVKLVLQDLPRLACFGFPIANEAYGEIARAGEFDSLFSTKIQFPNVEVLKLSSLKVKKIWNDQCIELCPFEKLKSLFIRCCGDLAHVLTCSMVRSLAQLKKIEIEDCKSMVEVISRSTGAEQELVLCSLFHLRMIGLPKVEKFCTSSVIRCPSLGILAIISCPRLHTFVSVGRVGDCDEACQQDLVLFDAKIEIPNLEKLYVSGQTGLKALWNDELHENSFHKLHFLLIECVKEMVTIFPSNWGMKRFQNLEELIIRDCHGLTEVYGELVDDVEEDAANSQLRKLELRNLPSLKHIWRKDPNNGYVKLGKLSHVNIYGCPSLKTVFPFSVAKGLVHLETLQIWWSRIEQIIGGDGEEVDAAAVFEFPMLTSLILRQLSQLESFCPATDPPEFPALRQLLISDCNGFPRSVFSQQKIYPNLEELTLDGKEIEMIRQGRLQKSNFLKLKAVELNFLKDEDDSCSFPLDLLPMFDNLETLRVLGGKFKELFPTEGLADDEKHQMICTKIRSLVLHSIFCLKTFWNEVIPALESLLVVRCENLINLAPSSASFKCLTSLIIAHCGGLLSLVTASTAKSFVQLKTLRVSNCNQLKVVVSDEGDEATGEITFKQLKTLELVSLPRLAIFSSTYHKFKFPCLIDVVVTQCPNMELFSKGVSTTPLLQQVRWARPQAEEACYGDLNSTISLCYRKMVGLQGMRHLKVFEHRNLKNSWNGELPVEFLCDLESLVVDDIPISSYAVPFNLLDLSNQLEELEVSNSEVVEEVFDVKIRSGADCGRTVLLSFLKSIHLINLPRLRNIWNVHLQGILNFNRLNSLKVHHCSSLKTILTPSVAEGLVQLKEIEVKYCDSVEEIISKGAGSEVKSEIIFPKLQSMKLESLPALVSLNGGSKVLKCPSLEHIEIADCPVTFTRAFLRQLQSNSSEQTTEPEIQLSNLTELRFSSIGLEKIWHNNSLEFSLYGKLTSLAVDGCGNLSCALTSLMVRNLAQLVTLKICDCKSIEEVVSTEGETEEKMAFPKLNFLKMKGLTRVVKFCTSNLLQCPSLKTLYIENCPRLQRFLSTSNEAGQQGSTLFDEKVEFPNLEDLEIIGVNKLEGLWGDELQEDSFNKLKYLDVKYVGKVVRIFPPNLLRRFKDLETLDVRGCDAIKEVFDIKALIDLKARGGAVVTQLKELRVYDNPNLLHVWNEDPNGILDFANLSLVDIDGCSSLQCVFPASIARGLVLLEVLFICDSGILHIIAPDQEENECAAVFKFLSLEYVILRRLPQLERLCAGMNTIEWPALKKVTVTDCSKLQKPAFLYTKAIPSLEDLALNGNEVAMIREGQLAVDMFHKLKYLELNYYDDSCAVFPFDIFHIFYNLESLCVVCLEFVEFFPPERPDGDHENQCQTVLKKIHSLELNELPNLKTFWNEVFENLERLLVKECDSLIILAPLRASFPNLTSLEVYKCDGLVSLVTSSTAKSLLRLKTLRVSECNQLKAIVSDDGGHEKPTNVIIFLKLETLNFDRLSSLSSFCSGNHSFRFPSLVKVIIKQSPNMEFFSEGVSTTPILQRVQSTEEDASGCWLGNLNSTVSFVHKKMVGLQGMRHLKVSEHPNVKNRWNRVLPVELLSDLESLVVDEIAISSYAVPSNLLDFLNQLEKLEVSNSEVAEEVFDVQIGSGAECGRTDLLPFLKSILLINLPRLKNIWNEHLRGILNLKHLNSLKVHHCSRLKMILTPSVAEGLVQLQEIEVKYCDSVEEIISKGSGSEVKSEIIFLTLQSMKLESLPALKSLSDGRKVLKCPSLEHIAIADCPSTFTHAFLRQLQSNASEQTTEPVIQLSNLTELRFSSIYLEKIWHNNSLEFSPYGKLTSLVVDGCGNLSCALTSSMVRNLAQLETLEICDCKSIEEVVSTDGETEEEMGFPELNFLKMKGLPRVVKFCTSNLLQCPSLKTLYIENCPRLQRFLSTGNEAGKQGSTLFDEKVEFPNLEDLMIVGVNELEVLWGNELREDSFYKLKYLNVRDAKKILRIFPPNLLRRFKDLETLDVRGCDAIKEVFDIKALIDLKARGGAVVTQLKELRVYDNPNLLHVWNEDPNGILDFANLSLVDIDGCSSLQCVFPASIARGLVLLEVLFICDSGILHIIAPDQEENECAAVFKFLSLEYVILKRLPQLERLCAGMNTIEMPALKKVTVTDCSKLQKPAFLYTKAIPSLEDLALNGNEVAMIREGQLAVDMFHKLKYLELNYYDDSCAVFPFDIFHIFYNLESLCVVCLEFVEFFPPERPDGDHENQCQTVLKKIHSLELNGLPNLKTFWNEVFENLERLLVKECDSLIILAPLRASFPNLTSLEVYKCDGLVSLVTSSTAKSLLRLKTLRVSACNQLKAIVSDDDEHEKVTGEIIFVKLKTLKLECLSNISSFCYRSNSFRFPSLEKVIMKQCPNMEFFSKGVSTTPVLERVKLKKEEDSGYWLGNLNSTVSFLHEKTIANKIEEH